MNLTSHQANAICSAVWLVGIGILIVTGFWWPGIMFVIGANSIVQGLVGGRGWYAFQGGVWSIGIGVWAMTNYNMLVLFCLLAISGLVGAFFKPPGLEPKPKPDAGLVDDGL